MKVLVTGVRGQLGYDVVGELTRRNIEVRGVDIDDFDLTDAKQVSEYISGYKPDVVIHCAAYTAVDRAEEDYDKCCAVNVDGTRNIAAAAKSVDAKLVYISTDYVFNGTGTEPFNPDSPVAPVNKYGESKLLGEVEAKKLVDKLFVVRISWVFGINGNNFIKSMINLSAKTKDISVVNDQIGSPTYTADLAPLLCDMILTEKYGTYCATNEGYCSWYDFAKAIFEYAGIDVNLSPISTAEYKASKAKRPANSRMSKDCLDNAGFRRLPEWQSALKRYINELKGA